MRPDMAHVLIDRPRTGGRLKYPRARRPRRVGEEFEGYRLQEGIGRPGGKPYVFRKELSDHIRPLYRFLDKQVGRPWDAVYAEVAAHLDFRSVLGHHLKSHLHDRVERHVVMVGRVAYAPLAGAWFPVRWLYVHPRTGLLMRAKPWWRKW